MFLANPSQLVCLLINFSLLLYSAQATNFLPTHSIEGHEHSSIGSGVLLPLHHNNQHEINPHETQVTKKADASTLVSDTIPFEAQILRWLQETFASSPQKSHIASLLNDQESYDFNLQLSTCDLLKRIGFESNTYESTSYDGYVTQLVQIVNPLQRSGQHGKRQTVVFYAGQGTSPAAFLVPSMDRQRPTAFDSKLASGELYFEEPANFQNRSLALTLANQGFDVWLVPARGVDQANRKRVKSDAIANTLQGSNPIAQLYGEVKRRDYWSFSADDIIKYELKQQFDLIRQHSNCEKFSLISYSNGAFISFGFMSQEMDYARRHIEAHISLGPAVFVNKFNLVLGGASALTHLSPPTLPFLEEHVDSFARGSFIKLCRSKLIRYSVCKLFLNNLYGHSKLFETFLELQWFDYIARPASTKHLRQTLQTAYSGRMRQYDFGLLGNLLIYGQLEPREYKLSECQLAKTFLIWGGKDAIVDGHSVAKLSKELGDKPKECLKVEEYNHLDLLFGWDVAERVNKPILRILKDKQMVETYYSGEKGGAHGSEHEQGGHGEHGSGHEEGGHHEEGAHVVHEPEQQQPEGEEYNNEDSRGINTNVPVQPPSSLLKQSARQLSASTAETSSSNKQNQQPNQSASSDNSRPKTGGPRVESTARQILSSQRQQKQTREGDAVQQQAKLATTTSGRQQTRAPRANEAE